MGTNYYLMKKADYKKEMQLYDIKRDFNYEVYTEMIEKLVKENDMYKEILKLHGKNSYEINEVESNMEDFISDTKWKFEDIFNIYDWDSNKIHIGKSSGGWLFVFQDSEFWHSYKEFKKFTMNMSDEWVIINEYNEVVTNKELLELIDEKQRDKDNIKNPDNFNYDRNVNGYRFTSTDFS